MGIGLGLAMGARLANPDRPVVCVTGDGSLGFTLAELDTMVRNDIPVVIVVMNNHSFFRLDAFARLADGTMPTIGTDLGAVRYADVAVAFGGFGRTVEREEELAPAIVDALASGIPAVVDVLVTDAFGPSFSMGAFRVME
jgi:thiamine pyrophosphate-dependent acetolactate synthase large subunit-like protein